MSPRHSYHRSRTGRPRIMTVAGAALSSRLIEGFGGGQWSHMANVLLDGTILDARVDWIKVDTSWYKPGVQLRPAGYLDVEPRWAVWEAPPHAEAVYSDWLAAGRRQLDKPYDKTGIYDFATGLFTGKYRDRNWGGEGSRAWFCDMLATWMAVHVGLVPQPPTRIYTLTPGAALNLFVGAGWRLVASRGTF